MATNYWKCENCGYEGETEKFEAREYFYSRCRGEDVFPLRISAVKFAGMKGIKLNFSDGSTQQI